MRRRSLRAVLSAGLLAVGLLVAGLTPGIPGASAATDYGVGRPLAAISRSAGNVEVYWRGSDGFLYEKAESGGVWGSPVRTPISGLASGPAATIGTSGYDYVFWEGTDGNLWEAANAPTGWIGPTKLGYGPLGSQPTATSIPNSTGVAEIDVFWEGTGSALWRAEYLTSTGKWAGPTRLGMNPLDSPPTATEQQTSAGPQIQVFWTGSDGSLLEGHTSGGTTWSGPTDLGMGPLGSAPAAASQSYGQEAVFWGGTFGRLWEADWTSATWNGAELNGPLSVGFGPMASAPAVAAQPGGWDVFWIGTDSNLWEATETGSAWTGEQSLGSMTPPPPAPPVPAPAPTPAPTPPATTPTTTTAPGKTTVTVKPKKPHHVDASITVKWQWNHARTRLQALKFKDLPKHATIRVSCGGKRCPWKALAVRKRERGSLISTLKHRVFRAGQTLTIKISSRGLAAERIRFGIRNGRAPTDALLK